MNQILFNEIKKLDKYIISNQEIPLFPKLNEIIRNKEKSVSNFINKNFPLGNGYNREFRKAEHKRYLKNVGLCKKNNYSLSLIKERFNVAKSQLYRSVKIDSCSVFCKLYFYDKKSKNLIRTKNINFILLGNIFVGSLFFKMFQMTFFNSYSYKIMSSRFKLYKKFEHEETNKSKTDLSGLNNNISYIYFLLFMFNYIHENLLKENENVYIKIFNMEKKVQLSNNSNINSYEKLNPLFEKYAYMQSVFEIKDKARIAYETHFIAVIKKTKTFINQLYCISRKKSIFIQKKGLIKCLISDSVFKKFKKNKFDIQESNLMLEKYFFECLNSIDVQLKCIKTYLLNINNNIYDEELVHNSFNYLFLLNTKKEYKNAIKKFNAFVKNRQKFLRYIGNTLVK